MLLKSEKDETFGQKTVDSPLVISAYILFSYNYPRFFLTYTSDFVLGVTIGIDLAMHEVIKRIHQVLLFPKIFQDF